MYFIKHILTVFHTFSNNCTKMKEWMGYQAGTVKLDRELLTSCRCQQMPINQSHQSSINSTRINSIVPCFLSPHKAPLGL